MEQKQNILTSAQQTYLPAIRDASPVFEHSLRRIPIVAIDAPDIVCGVAYRIGSTGKSGNDLAMYRLKLKTSFSSLKTATLPGFFVIENGIFVEL
ncbi:MAG TPA: hypothetical protein VFA09_14595 [Ktedonobacteraceae bacterium]|nr:hypothetical protein [Ktedonobacteraceae bacterium]